MWVASWGVATHPMQDNNTARCMSADAEQCDARHVVTVGPAAPRQPIVLVAMGSIGRSAM